MHRFTNTLKGPMLACTDSASQHGSRLFTNSLIPLFSQYVIYIKGMHTFCSRINALPNMLILGFFNSAANDDVASKEWTNWDKII